MSCVAAGVLHPARAGAPGSAAVRVGPPPRHGAPSREERPREAGPAVAGPATASPPAPAPRAAAIGRSRRATAKGPRPRHRDRKHWRPGRLVPGRRAGAGARSVAVAVTESGAFSAVKGEPVASQASESPRVAAQAESDVALLGSEALDAARAAGARTELEGGVSARRSGDAVSLVRRSGAHEVASDFAPPDLNPHWDVDHSERLPRPTGASLVDISSSSTPEAPSTPSSSVATAKAAALAAQNSTMAQISSRLQVMSEKSRLSGASFVLVLVTALSGPFLCCGCVLGLWWFSVLYRKQGARRKWPVPTGADAALGFQRARRGSSLAGGAERKAAAAGRPAMTPQEEQKINRDPFLTRG